MGHMAMTTKDLGRVLLVDDDYGIRTGYARTLERRGWTVVTAMDGLEARERLAEGSFEVILSDIHMPGYGGLQLLRTVRERDLDVPVILMTGMPAVDSSILAIEHGVFRYLVKPIAPDTLAEVITRAASLHKMALLKRRALEIAGSEGKWLGDRASLEGHFAKALESLWVAFQPIVSWSNHRVLAYEALLRSKEPTLATPGAFLEAATRLGRLRDVGRAVRAKVADEVVGKLPTDIHVYINLDASDLDDDNLHDSCSQLAGMAHRVVLEITERASLDNVKDVSSRVKKLKEIGFRIAIDDLGAGYAGLASFTQLDPEVVKIDMSLTRNIDTHHQKQSIVRSMKKLCDDLRVLMVVEGVETKAERDTLVSLGCDIFQGYLFAKPQPGFPAPQW
jgi:EAL domain-containing protein (putative c-di-GMP-specific phosphodiesterase class I)